MRSDSQEEAVGRVELLERQGAPVIEYEVHGDGFPVVLLHGGASDRRLWADAGYVGELARHFRLILVDQRGAGGSGRPTAVDAHQMDRYVEDLLAVLDAEDVQDFACWGLSMGGQVALALAVAAPERVRALVIQGADIQGWSDEPESYEAFADQIQQQGMEAVISAFDDPARPLPNWMHQAMAETDPRAFAAAMRARAKWPGISDRAGALAIPVLFLGGEHEYPPGKLEEMSALLPRGQAARIQGADHIHGFVRADLALAAALPFLLDATIDAPPSRT